MELGTKKTSKLLPLAKYCVSSIEFFVFFSRFRVHFCSHSESEYYYFTHIISGLWTGKTEELVNYDSKNSKRSILIQIKVGSNNIL